MTLVDVEGGLVKVGNALAYLTILCSCWQGHSFVYIGLTTQPYQPYCVPVLCSTLYSTF